MYGDLMQDAKRQTYLSLGSFTANTTVTPAPRFGVSPGSEYSVRITGIDVSCSAVPVDADGDMSLSAIVNDISEGADDTIVAAEDLEALVTAANQYFAATLAAETSEKQLTLAPGDSLRFELDNDSAGIGTNAEVNVLVTYFIVPHYDEFERVQQASQYLP